MFAVILILMVLLFIIREQYQIASTKPYRHSLMMFVLMLMTLFWIFGITPIGIMVSDFANNVKNFEKGEIVHTIENKRVLTLISTEEYIYESSVVAGGSIVTVYDLSFHLVATSDVMSGIITIYTEGDQLYVIGKNAFYTVSTSGETTTLVTLEDEEILSFALLYNDGYYVMLEDKDLRYYTDETTYILPDLTQGLQLYLDHVELLIGEGDYELYTSYTWTAYDFLYPIRSNHLAYVTHPDYDVMGYEKKHELRLYEDHVEIVYLPDQTVVYSSDIFPLFYYNNPYRNFEFWDDVLIVKEYDNADFLFQQAERAAVVDPYGHYVQLQASGDYVFLNEQIYLLEDNILYEWKVQNPLFMASTSEQLLGISLVLLVMVASTSLPLLTKGGNANE